MGVPKFFRFISERYPCLSQLVSEWEIPEFDNLYLDMNGIIHNCSHPSDYDPHFRISEEKIFKDIFQYIEVLFRIIKPKKLFFLAVDGVAPRAKMNQQRGRRFRSAKETEDRDKEVVRKGGQLPDGQRFDSNCITPGTSFMARLQAQLQYFISSKISIDKAWQKVKVILSGHECPGEGEHKIMDYIRYMRVQPDYDPNTRHCLYGLDADLIMLGLCTHEPHFSLLREEVKFGRKQSKKILSPEETKFFLLHLSLLREYLEMEFDRLKSLIPFEFNLENVIDDWVLMGFLVGNDFIPHLPGLHISSGALPLLYQVYCDILPELDGYLNEGGTLNLARFEAYMKKLASYDIKQFRELYGDFKYLKSKCNANDKDQNVDSFNKMRQLEPYFEEGEDVECENLEPSKEKPSQMFFGKLEAVNQTENREVPKNQTDDECTIDKRFLDRSVQEMMELEESDDSISSEYEEDGEDRLQFFKEFCLHKQNYYQDKLEYKEMNEEVIRDLAEGYIRAIQWNLNYYYNGLCSWSWFYPHHYAPYISDIQNFKDMNLEFDLGKPFLPFEQLLAVLPAFSKNLLPEPFQELMTNENSPVFDYYPVNFRTDLNGKKNDWEALVLIPFIDEKRLLDAMRACYDRLTDEEKERNKHGPMHVFTFSAEHLGRLEAPAYFHPLEKNHALHQLLTREDILVPREKLNKGLLPGALTDVYFDGFPTFKHIPHTSELRAEGVKVFQTPSQNLNMIVKVDPLSTEVNHESLVNSYLNEIVHVDWPYLSEAKVVSIKSATKETSQQGRETVTEFNTDEDGLFESQKKHVSKTFLKSRGIDSGVVEYIIVVRPLEGQKYVFTENRGEMNIRLEKKWSDVSRPYPLQLVIKNLKTNSNLIPNVTTDDVFPVDCNCFILNARYYGCLGMVTDESTDGHVKLRVDTLPEPTPNDLKIRHTISSYYTNAEAAQRACIPGHLLARITGTILVLDADSKSKAQNSPRVNIGLNLKFSRRNQQLPGYTRRLENNQWLYSDRTIQLIREYANEFPDVIKYLAKNSDQDLMLKTDLFPLPGQHHMLKVISNWLESKTELRNERRSCDAVLLEPDEISELESRIEKFLKKTKHGRHITVKVTPNQLFKPSTQMGRAHPDPDNSEYSLLDRVVNAKENYSVPLGAKGTIIGIEKQQDDPTAITCDVLFDQTFQAATQYYTKKKRIYKIPSTYLLNISCAARRRTRETAKQSIRNHISGNNKIPNRETGTPNALSKFLADNARSYSNVCKVQKPQFNTQNVPVQPTYVEQTDMSAILNKQLRINAPLPHHDSVNSRVPISATVNGERKNPVLVQRPNPDGDSTLALKKILKISSDSKTNEETPKVVKNQEAYPAEKTVYTSKLMELFQKARRPIPNYSFSGTEGCYTATLKVPGIDFVLNGDQAVTKGEACEKTAFVVLNSLNVVQRYGDPIPFISDNIVHELNMRLDQLSSRRTAQFDSSMYIQYSGRPDIPLNTANFQPSYPGNVEFPVMPNHKPQLPSQNPMASVCGTISSQPCVERPQIAFMANYVYLPLNVTPDTPVNSQPFYPPHVQDMLMNPLLRPGMHPPPPLMLNSYAGAQWSAPQMFPPGIMQPPFGPFQQKQLPQFYPPFNMKNKMVPDGIPVSASTPNNVNSNTPPTYVNLGKHVDMQPPQSIPLNPDQLFAKAPSPAKLSQLNEDRIDRTANNSMSSSQPLNMTVEDQRSFKMNKTDHSQAAPPRASPRKVFYSRDAFPPTLDEIRGQGPRKVYYSRDAFPPTLDEIRGQGPRKVFYSRDAFPPTLDEIRGQSVNSKVTGNSKKSPQQPSTHKTSNTPKSSKKSRLAANFSKKPT